MAKPELEKKAIKLRKQGMSYSQIKECIDVSKSTLSRWLRDYPLSDKRIRELRDNNAQRIEKYRRTRRKQREAQLEKIYDKEKGRILPINKRNLFIAGLLLYWGEGEKTSIYTVGVSNSNPATHKLFIRWLETIYSVPRSKLKVRVHLYKDMDVEEELDWWATELGVSREQFGKPYVKDSRLADIGFRNPYQHGTCNVLYWDAKVGKRVHMALKVIEDYFNGHERGIERA